MIWHFFKKDWRLLWPMVVLLWSGQAVYLIMQFQLGTLGEPEIIARAAVLLSAALSVASAILIALAVYQDAIPGVRQDWLVRPIARTDLLLAKILFVLLIIVLPLLGTDILAKMTAGFSVGESLKTALSREGYWFLFDGLMILAFAAVTRNVAQLVGAAIAYFIGNIVAMAVLSGPLFNGGASTATNPIVWTGIGWLYNLSGSLVVFIGVIVVLRFQYFRRKTADARILLGSAVLLGTLTIFLPWKAAFSVEHLLSPDPDAGSRVAVTFDQGLGRFRPAPGQNVNEYISGAGQIELRGRSAGDIPAENQRRASEGAATIFLPLRISNVGTGSILWSDRADMRLIDSDGRTIYRRMGDDFDPRRMISNGHDITTYQEFRISAELYDHIKDRPLRLEVDYSLSLLGDNASTSLPALNGARMVVGMGACATEVDDDADGIDLRCIEGGSAPSCASVILESPSRGKQNPELLICSPDYAPFLTRKLPDRGGRISIEVPFRDKAGLAQYAVDGSMLPEAQVTIKPYQPVDHFTRHLEILDIRLADWEAETAAPPTE